MSSKARELALLPVKDFVATPGFGVTAFANGRKVEVGAARAMSLNNLNSTVFATQAARFADEGKSPLYVAIDGALAAIIAVADRIKPSSAPTIEALHARGLRVAMVTGDNRRTAEAVGRLLEIDDVVADVLPKGKVDAIKAFAATGACVIFIGDGINDAPALATADVGIAVGTGTDIAIESADVVLMSGDLDAVASAIELSRATMRNIRQNLFWAFAYNAALIPIAGGLLYPLNGTLLSPMLAAGAMAFSSLFVVANALRLRHFRGHFAERAIAAREVGLP